jgi:hypothetical protein
MARGGGGSWFTKEYRLLFGMLAARRHWYVVVEVAVSSVSGVIGGTVPGGSGAAGCEPQRVALVAVAAVELLMLLLLRPLSTRLRAASAVANAAVLLLSASLVLASSSAAGTVVLVGVVVVAVTSVLVPLASLWYGRRLPKAAASRPRRTALSRQPAPGVDASGRSPASWRHERVASLIELICRSRRCP